MKTAVSCVIIWIKLNFYSRSRYCFLGKFIVRSVCHCCWFFVWFISLNSVLSAGYKLTLGWLIFLRIDDSVYRLKSFEKILLVSFQNIASIFFSFRFAQVAIWLTGTHGVMLVESLNWVETVPHHVFLLREFRLLLFRVSYSRYFGFLFRYMWIGICSCFVCLYFYLKPVVWRVKFLRGVAILKKLFFSLSIILQKTLRYRTHVFYLFFPSFFTLFSFLIAMFTYSMKRRKIIWFIISPTRIKGVNHNMLNFWTSQPMTWKNNMNMMVEILNGVFLCSNFKQWKIVCLYFTK